MTCGIVTIASGAVHATTIEAGSANEIAVTVLSTSQHATNLDCASDTSLTIVSVTSEKTVIVSGDHVLTLANGSVITTTVTGAPGPRGELGPVGPASESAVPAICSALELVGHAVYVVSESGGVPVVARCDPADVTKMPAIGVVASKPTATTCLVLTSGDHVESGLVPGRQYWIGTDGRPTSPPPVASMVPLFWQLLGTASLSTRLRLNVAGRMHRRLP